MCNPYGLAKNETDQKKDVRVKICLEFTDFTVVGDNLCRQIFPQLHYEAKERIFIIEVGTRTGKTNPKIIGPMSAAREIMNCWNHFTVKQPTLWRCLRKSKVDRSRSLILYQFYHKKEQLTAVFVICIEMDWF